MTPGEAIRAGVLAALVERRPLAVTGLKVRTVKDTQDDAELVVRLTPGGRNRPYVELRARAFGDPRWGEFGAYVAIYVVGWARIGEPAELVEVVVGRSFVADPARWQKAAGQALDRAGAIMGAAADSCGFWNRSDPMNGANDDDQPVGGEGFPRPRTRGDSTAVRNLKRAARVGGGKPKP